MHLTSSNRQFPICDPVLLLPTLDGRNFCEIVLISVTRESGTPMPNWHVRSKQQPPFQLAIVVSAYAMTLPSFAISIAAPVHSNVERGQCGRGGMIC